MKKQDESFYKKLVQISSELGMNPEVLLNVMALESGLDSNAGNRIEGGGGHNGSIGAVGLIQFMPSTLKWMGFTGTQEDFAEKSAIEQLDYVKQYVKSFMGANGGPFTSAVQYYVANFLPACLQMPGIRNNDLSTVLVEKDTQVKHIPGQSIEQERLIYKVNSGLDVDHDGKITLGDLKVILDNITHNKDYKAALADMARYTDYKPEEHPMDKQEAPKSDTYETLLNKFMTDFAGKENDFLIKISGEDFVSRSEYTRILCNELNKNNFKKAYTYTDNDNVEIMCKGTDINLLKNILNKYSKEFTNYTDLNFNYKIFSNKKSSFKPINVKVAQANYRKFLLKII